MSGEAQAGTPAAEPENSQETGQAEAASDGSGQNAQQQKELMVWKQKAEEFNRVKQERDALEARLAQMERLAVSQGANQATDPEADEIAALRELASVDPVARATLRNKQEIWTARAEAWLAGQLLAVPEAKRSQVAALIRNANYQASVEEALAVVTDPESAVSKTRIAELEAENKRLKERAVQPHGVSPATTQPASDAKVSSVENMPWSEASAILKAGGDRARELRDKMDTRKVKIEHGR